MDFETTVKLLSMMQRIYPNHVKMMERDEFEITCKLWGRVLHGIGNQDCMEALIIHARQSKYPPTPSEIYDIVLKKHEPHLYKSGEIAWEEVCKAVRKYGFSRQSEAFEEFDDKTKRVVKATGWWNICYSEKPEFVKKEFISLWDNIKSVEQEQKAVENTKWFVEQIKKYGGALEERGSLGDSK
jgi:hypothetical protein